MLYTGFQQQMNFDGITVIFHFSFQYIKAKPVSSSLLIRPSNEKVFFQSI